MAAVLADCGGFFAVNASVNPIPVSYVGSKGFADSQELMVPATVSDLFLWFGSNSDDNSGLPFFIQVTNCTKTDYVPCMNYHDMTCFNQEDPIEQGKCKVITTIPSTGNSTGVWFKNPLVSPFMLVFYVVDHYYQNPRWGNSASGQFSRSSVTIQYQG